MIEVISGFPPFGGSEGKGMGEGSSGLESQMRLQEVALPGMAVSLEDTTTNANKRNVWKYGNSSARPEFFGVLVTKGVASTLSLVVTDTNSNDVSVVWSGYAPVLVAPGYAVRPGQYLEPIPAGTSQALFRPAASGRGAVMALDYLDNTGGSAGAWTGAYIIPRQVCTGLVGSVGPSSNLTGTTSETVYQAGSPLANLTIALPANSWRVGSSFRVSGAILSNNIAAGANTAKGYINGLTSGLLFTAPAVTYQASDVVMWDVTARVQSLSGSNNVALSGFVSAGTPGTATARAVAGLMTMDTTVDNLVSIANTPNNNADSSKLLFNLVERLG